MPQEEEHKLLYKLKNSSSAPQTPPTSPFTDSASNQPDSPPLQATPRADRALSSSEAVTPLPDTSAPVDQEEAGAQPDDEVAAAPVVLDEQERIDAILKKLFFSPRNQLISEGTVFDPSVRCAWMNFVSVTVHVLTSFYYLPFTSQPY